MAFELSNFSPEFYGDINEPVSSAKPTTIADAIASLTVEERKIIAKEVFNLDSEFVSDTAIYEQVLRVSTVHSLTSPVAVFIDEHGYHVLRVHDGD